MSAGTSWVDDASPSSLAFRESYLIVRQIGRGAFGFVFEAVHIRDGTPRAVKVLRREEMNAEDKHAVQAELNVMKALDHPNLVRLIDVFGAEPTDPVCYMVMELCDGGELFARVVEKTAFTEDEARGAIWQALQGLQAMHNAGYIHLDVKPENILYESRSEGARLKLCDFGFAESSDATTRSLLVPTRGTPQYCAPEVLLGHEYGFKADVWAVGVLTYVLLGGYPPFHEKSKRRLFRSIVHGRYEFHDRFWCHTSDEAIHFIRWALQVDPSARPTTEQLLGHPWLAGGAPQQPDAAESVATEVLRASDSSLFASESIGDAEQTPALLERAAAAPSSASDTPFSPDRSRIFSHCPEHASAAPGVTTTAGLCKGVEDGQEMAPPPPLATAAAVTHGWRGLARLRAALRASRAATPATGGAAAASASADGVEGRVKANAISGSTSSIFSSSSEKGKARARVASPLTRWTGLRRPTGERTRKELPPAHLR